jgi:hypothetical protein
MNNVFEELNPGIIFRSYNAENIQEVIKENIMSRQNESDTKCITYYGHRHKKTQY